MTVQSSMGVTIKAKFERSCLHGLCENYDSGHKCPHNQTDECSSLWRHATVHARQYLLRLFWKTKNKFWSACKGQNSNSHFISSFSSIFILHWKEKTTTTTTTRDIKHISSTIKHISNRMEVVGYLLPPIHPCPPIFENT